MPNRVQKLPLTAYDILGYLIPGATFFILLGYVLHGLKIFERATPDPMTFGGASLVLIGVVFSYIAGHGLALLSSFTIERLVIMFFGYPSGYLVSNVSKVAILKNVLSKKLAALAIMFFAPFSILQFLLLSLLSTTEFVRHFIKSFNVYTIHLLDDKFHRRYGKHIAEISGADWFNIVEHDVLNYSQIGAARMYNYLNLYGFCRNMACAMSILALSCALRATFSDEKLPQHYLMFFIGVAIFGGLLTLGFMKFFRRYSQEAVMAFIVSQDERDKPTPVEQAA